MYSFQKNINNPLNSFDFPNEKNKGRLRHFIYANNTAFLRKFHQLYQDADDKIIECVDSTERRGVATVDGVSSVTVVGDCQIIG